MLDHNTCKQTVLYVGVWVFLAGWHWLLKNSSDIICLLISIVCVLNKLGLTGLSFLAYSFLSIKISLDTVHTSWSLDITCLLVSLTLTSSEL